MKKFTLVFLVLCLSFTLVYAGGRSVGSRSVFGGNLHDKFGSNSIAYSFFPLVNNGFGIEYDRLLTPKTNRHWLKIAPTYYTSLNYSTLRSNAIKSLQGFSVGVYHKYCYYEIERVGFQLFLQWGANYEMYNIEGLHQDKTHIDKIGIDFSLGFRQIIVKPLFFDFSIGYGNRFVLNHTTNGTVISPTDNKPIEVSKFDGNMFDYGYGGPALNINLTLGFVF